MMSKSAHDIISARGWTEQHISQLNSEIVVFVYGVLIGIIITLVIKSNGESRNDT